MTKLNLLLAGLAGTALASPWKRAAAPGGGDWGNGQGGHGGGRGGWSQGGHGGWGGHGGDHGKSDDQNWGGNKGGDWGHGGEGGWGKSSAAATTCQPSTVTETSYATVSGPGNTVYNTMYHTTTATEEETQYVTETKKMPPKISTITTTEE
ncbi:hypothetical protein KC334_g11424, partial [Hortaea werneckii]